MVFTFFIVAILWIFVGARVGWERDESKKFDLDRKNGEASDQKKRERWIKSVTNKEIEDSIFYEIIRSDISSEIANEIRQTLKDIPFLSYSNFESLWVSRQERGNMKLFQRIVLANRGMLLYDDAENIYGISPDLYVLGFDSNGMNKYERLARLLLWIQKKLEDFDIYERPLYKKEGRYYETVSEQNITSSDLLVWEPMIPYYANINEH